MTAHLEHVSNNLFGTDEVCFFGDDTDAILAPEYEGEHRFAFIY